MFTSPPSAEVPAKFQGMPIPDCPTCFPGGNTFTEQENGGDSGARTFRYPRDLAGEGDRVPVGQRVEVVCRFQDPNADRTVQPGWFYLIDSSPWNRQYYAVANSFLNGDPPEGPPDTPVDVSVPIC